MYERTVLPYIQAIPPARLQWVYNVLERKVGPAHPTTIRRYMYEAVGDDQGPGEDGTDLLYTPHTN